jgi:hypothetical protein
MILFDLKCGKNHVFEAWFRDGDSADLQIAGGKITCPTCGNGKVAKAPMAPRIGKGSEPRAAEKQVENSEIAAKSAMVGNALRELRAKIEADFDYVGDRFAEEARKIHYGETDARGIYGETSDEDARELSDEGIEFTRVPWLPRHDS